MWGRWVGGLEFGNSQLAFPRGNPHVEFPLVTGKEGIQSKVVLQNRHVLHWDEIKDSKFLGKKSVALAILQWQFIFLIRNGIMLILILCHSWI